jgi:Flp pilus assembly protein TadG
MGRDRRGSVAVEFAILLPVFLLFVLGIAEFGRALWIRQAMQFAVEEATRYGLADSTLTTSQVNAKASSVFSSLSSESVTFSTTTSSSSMTVSATDSFTFLVPDLLPFGPFTLTAQSTFPK